MNQYLIPFQFSGKPVQVIMLDGEPWWVAHEICELLGLTNPRDAVTRLDADERKSLKNNSVGKPDGVINQQLNPNQMVTVVSEPGLYALIFRSNKPEAKAFRRWVLHEVVPTVRRQGGYLSAVNLAELRSEVAELRRLVRGQQQVLAKAPFRPKIAASAYVYWEAFKEFLVGKDYVTAFDLRYYCAPELSAVMVGRIMSHFGVRSFAKRIGDQVLRVYRGITPGYNLAR